MSVLSTRFGPLVRHWTMRYEARHCYFKKLAHSIGNYINVSWTLGLRHQLLQCYYSVDRETICPSCPEVGPG